MNAKWSMMRCHFAVLAVIFAAMSAPVQAHPHMWVTVETTVVYENSRITGLKHRWVFDDMYSAMATQGLDTNGDGAFSREELAELAKVNVESLKEFSYFTVAKLKDVKVKWKDPTEYYLKHKDSLLELHFTLPLEEPVLADAEGLNFAVFDESFYIAFDFGKEDPVKLAGAPQGCAASIGIPDNEIKQLQALNDAFGGMATAGDANEGMGMGYARTVTLGCKGS